MRRKSTSLVLAATLLLGLAAFAPVAAATKTPVGTRLDLRFPVATFDASTPFHIKHGWALESTEDWIGLYSFSLDVDSAPRALDFVQRFVISGNPDTLVRFWVFNFPAGLTGTHTFTGHWFGPCGPTSVCAAGQSPNTVVELITESRTVTFS